MKELNFKTSFKIALRGKWVTRVITILLSAFSFALVALASTGLLYNRMEYYITSYQYFLQNSRYVSFNCGSSSNDYHKDYRLDDNMIKHITDETKLSYVYSYLDPSALQYLFYYVDYAKNGYIGDREWFNKIETNAHSGFWFGNESSYNSLGFQVLAGRYPQNEYEVALSEQHFEFFTKAGGYFDITDRYKLVKDGKLEDGSQPWEEQPGSRPYSDGYWFDNVTEYDLSTAVPITCYEDLLGKEFLCYGTTESGERDLQTVYKMKVVGIVNTEDGGEKDNSGVHRVNGRILLSEKWLKANHHQVQYMTARAPEITKSFAKTCVDLSFELADDYMQKIGAVKYDRAFLVGAHAFDALYRDHEMNDETLMEVVFGGAGLFFGVFAVLLNGHMIAASLELKRKQVGVLRSMGASEKSVRRIFMLEALFIGLCSFTVALGISLGVYYGWLKSLMIMNAFNACAMIYNGWTVLFLAVISIGVPLLCALLPLKKFFKKPIVENISGNSSQK